MRKATIVTCLLIPFVICFVNAKYSLSQGNRMKRPNDLGKVRFIPKKDLIVGTCDSEPNGSIRFWSIVDGDLKDILDLGKGVWATSLAVSHNGSSIVVGMLVKDEIACYSITEKKWLWKVRWVEDGLIGNPMQFTPDDRKVIVLGARNIIAYDAKTGAILQRQVDAKRFSEGFPEYRTRNNGISASTKYAAFWQGNLEHDEGRSSSRNIWVLVRDIETGKTIAKQGNIQEKFKNCSATFTPDENNLLLGSMDGYIRVWSITEQKVIREWRAHGTGEPVSFEKGPAPEPIHSITFSPSGRYLATMGGSPSAIRIWDYTAKKLIHEFVEVISSGLPMCLGYPIAFSPDGKYFAFEQQGWLCLYDSQTWEEKWCVPSLPKKNPSK
jgi:WD40 repeat protein